MSRFGKKALIKWDYEDHSKEKALRFLATEKGAQLAILKKWYPAGIRCRKFQVQLAAIGEAVYEILGYAEKQEFWAVEMRPIGTENKIEANPAYVLPEEEFLKGLKRDEALNNLLRRK